MPAGGLSTQTCEHVFARTFIGRQQMNIFVLDRDIPTCARYHADQHVIKMILESAQMLCTVINQAGGDAPYRSTHGKHPCTLWTGRSLSNWQWLKKLGLALNDEYRYRFRTAKHHRSAEIIMDLALPEIPDLGLTAFALAMPDKYKIEDDPVAAYRAYYIGDKAGFVRWTRRRVPKWFKQAVGAGCQ